MMTIEESKNAYKRSEPFTFSDPSLARMELPYTVTFFPLGFPVEIATNSSDVLDAAAENWLGYSRLFKTNPIRIRIAVQESDSTECPPTPVVRRQQHLISNVADSNNFVVADLIQQCSFAWITKATVAHPNYLRYFFLEFAVLAHIAARYTTGIHGACVELDGRGILLCGDSGSGKSTLSYACAQAGWTYITDDGSYLVHGRDDRMVVGNFKQIRFRPSAIELFPELNDRPVMCRAEVGTPSIELLTSPFKQLKRAPSSHVAHIVFLNRQGVKRQDLVPFPKPVAKHFMLQMMTSVPNFESSKEAELDKFLETKILELRYRDLNWAIGRLTRLVREGH
jgi:hypothetical protein